MCRKQRRLEKFLSHRCPYGCANGYQFTATANGITKCELWQHIQYTFDIIRRDVVSNISMGPILFNICAHNRWRDLFCYFATAQIRQIFSAAYHNNGCIATIDIGCCQFGGSCICVQSVRLSNASFVCIVLGYWTDRGSSMCWIHTNLSDFVTQCYKNYICDIYLYIQER